MKSIYRNLITFPLIVLINFSAFGCRNSRSAQCQQIIDSVNKTSEQLKTVGRTTRGEESFIKAVETIEQGADELEAIELKDQTLKDLTSYLVQVRRELVNTIHEIEDVDVNNDKQFMEIANRQEKAAKLSQSLMNDISFYCSGGKLPTIQRPSPTS